MALRASSMRFCQSKMSSRFSVATSRAGRLEPALVILGRIRSMYMLLPAILCVSTTQPARRGCGYGVWLGGWVCKVGGQLKEVGGVVRGSWECG